MSKSAESDLSRINLLDEPKLITKKVKSAKTDTFEGLEYDDPARPEARNLMTIYALSTGMSMVSHSRLSMMCMGCIGLGVDIPCQSAAALHVECVMEAVAS